MKASYVFPDAEFSFEEFSLRYGEFGERLTSCEMAAAAALAFGANTVETTYTRHKTMAYWSVSVNGRVALSDTLGKALLDCLMMLTREKKKGITHHGVRRL